MNLAPIIDCTSIREWAVNPDLAEFFRRFPAIWSLTDEGLRSLLSTSYYITANEEEQPCGLISLTAFDAHAKKVEMGVAILPREGRRELAAEAAKLVGEYVFDRLGYRKITFQTLSHREDLKALALSFNFKHEATLRDNCFWAGTYHDECVYGLLSEEFQWRK